LVQSILGRIKHIKTRGHSPPCQSYCVDLMRV